MDKTNKINIIPRSKIILLIINNLYTTSKNQKIKNI